jgi:homoserine kinase
MGPGFDSFGFAVDLENELLVERGPFAMEIVGEGAESLPVREERGQMDGWDCFVCGVHTPRKSVCLRFCFALFLPPRLRFVTLTL